MVLPRPMPFANVFSIGDVLIGSGAVVFLVRTMRRRPLISTRWWGRPAEASAAG
jgi:hypothetical protein